MKKKHTMRNVLIGVVILLGVFFIWFALYFKLDPTNPTYYTNRGGMTVVLTKRLEGDSVGESHVGDKRRFIFWHPGEDPNRFKSFFEWKTGEDSIDIQYEEGHDSITNFKRDKNGVVTATVSTLDENGTDNYRAKVTSFWALQRYIQTTTR